MNPMRWWALAALCLIVVGGAGRAAGQSRGERTGDGTTWLGVYSQELTRDLREGLEYNGTGVLINRVADDSPAERAGLRKGDVLVSVNQRTIDSPEELAEVIRAREAGQTVSLRIVRDGRGQTLTARLEERPRDTGEREFEFFAPDAPEAPDAPDAPEAPEAPEPFTWKDGSGKDVRIVTGVGRGRLGVRVEDLTPGLNEYFNVPGGQGALVVEVLEDTPADKAGLRAGDVITRVGTRTIDDAAELRDALAGKEGKVSVEVRRKGVARTLEAELEDAPRVMRFHSGDGDEIRRIAPEIRRELRRLGPEMRRLRDLEVPREDLAEEMKQLREELRELKKEIAGMKGGN